MTDWLRARNGWTLLLINWAVTLASWLLGTVTAVMISRQPLASFAPHLPWVAGGSLFAALGGTGGALYRRRRQG